MFNILHRVRLCVFVCHMSLSFNPELVWNCKISMQKLYSILKESSRQYIKLSSNRHLSVFVPFRRKKLEVFGSWQKENLFKTAPCVFAWFQIQKLPLQTVHFTVNFFPSIVHVTKHYASTKIYHFMSVVLL